MAGTSFGRIASRSSGLGGSMSWFVAADLSGRFVYVANQGGGITAYALDLVTGNLTAVTGSPFAAGTGPISVTTTVTIQ